MRLMTAVFLFCVILALDVHAQERITIKESPEQCYQDLKQALFGITDWDDRNRVAHGACNNTNNIGMACYTFQVLSEQEADRKKKNPDPNKCILFAVVQTTPNVHSSTERWNQFNGFRMHQMLSSVAAKIEDIKRHREKRIK